MRGQLSVGPYRHIDNSLEQPKSNIFDHISSMNKSMRDSSPAGRTKTDLNTMGDTGGISIELIQDLKTLHDSQMTPRQDIYNI
jgi:hypothetical protein